MAQLFSNVGNLTWQQAVMWLIGGILIYLAVKRDMEPALLLPMGFGAILVNLPLSGAVTQIVDGVEEIGVLNVLFDAGIANELFPLLLFVGIGAMIDFEPLLNDPKLMFFGAAAQFGIVVGVDVRDRKVSIAGWLETSDVDYLTEYAEIGHTIFHFGTQRNAWQNSILVPLK